VAYHLTMRMVKWYATLSFPGETLKTWGCHFIGKCGIPLNHAHG
jgi:hypothetical protein